MNTISTCSTCVFVQCTNITCSWSDCTVCSHATTDCMICGDDLVRTHELLFIAVRNIYLLFFHQLSVSNVLKNLLHSFPGSLGGGWTSEWQTLRHVHAYSSNKIYNYGLDHRYFCCCLPRLFLIIGLNTLYILVDDFDFTINLLILGYCFICAFCTFVCTILIQTRAMCSEF